MMKVIVGVKDRAINTFGTVFVVRTTNEAIRSFTDEANNKQSAINQHPEDYDLYLIASFDDETATILQDKPGVIARAQDLIKSYEHRDRIKDQLAERVATEHAQAQRTRNIEEI